MAFATSTTGCGGGAGRQFLAARRHDVAGRGSVLPLAARPRRRVPASTSAPLLPPTKSPAIHRATSSCRSPLVTQRRGGTQACRPFTLTDSRAPSACPVPPYYFRSASTLCGAALACARIAVPACCRICALVRFAVSDAKSASRIRLRDACQVLADRRKLAIVDSKRFWIAPKVLRKRADRGQRRVDAPIVVLRVRQTVGRRQRLVSFESRVARSPATSPCTPMSGTRRHRRA